MGKNIFRVLFAFALSCALLQVSFIYGYSQSNVNLSIDSVDSTKFPSASIYVSVSNAQGIPIRGLTTKDFTLVENNKNLPIQDVAPVYQKPLTIALVIDTSRSTGYGATPPLSNIIQTATEFVDTLALNDQVAIVSFSDDVVIQQAPTSDRTLIKDAMNSLKSGGNASLNDAVVTTVNLLKDQPGRHLLILLTDGPDSGFSKYTFDQAMDDASRQSVVVYPIAYGGADREELGKLADFTNGKVNSITGETPDLKAFQAAFNDLTLNLPELREQYQLRFTSAQQADGNEHEFIVRVSFLGEEVEMVGKLTAQPGDVVIALPGLQDGQVVGGNVQFAPIISAPATLTTLDLTMDGQAIANVSAAPFEYLWDSTSTQPGLHKFILTAQDSAGNSGAMEINLSVQLPITINIVSPTNQQMISGSTMISTNVTALAQISRVEFSIDDAPPVVVSAPPYDYLWDLKGVPAGNHKISVTAYDLNGFPSKNSINVNVAIQQSSGLIWLVGIAALVMAGVLIPLALHSRKRLKKLTLVSPAESTPPGQAAPTPTSTARLFEIDGINPNQVWALSTEDTHLGRKRDENDIPLKGIRASRKHAVIRYTQGKYVIFSVNPENPVSINDQPVHQQVLNNGDVIQAGETTLRFELPSDGA